MIMGEADRKPGRAERMMVRVGVVGASAAVAGFALLGAPGVAAAAPVASQGLPTHTTRQAGGNGRGGIGVNLLTYDVNATVKFVESETHQLEHGI